MQVQLTQDLEVLIQYFHLSHQLVAVVQVLVTKELHKLLVVQAEAVHNTDKAVVQVIHHQFLHHKVIMVIQVLQILEVQVAAVAQDKLVTLIVGNQVVQVEMVQQIQSQVLP